MLPPFTAFTVRPFSLLGTGALTGSYSAQGVSRSATLTRFIDRRRTMSKVTKDGLVVALAACGWETDRFGNMQREREMSIPDAPMRKQRIKFQATSVRFEVQLVFPSSEYSPARTEWLRLDGAYMKDIKIREDGVVIIGGHLFKPGSKV